MAIVQHHSFECISDLLAAMAAKQGRAIAIESMDGVSITYEKLQQIVNAGTAALRSHGLAGDDRVAIVLPNGPGMALALLAVSCSAVAVPLNPASRRGEFLRYFQETKITALVAPACSDSSAIEVANQLGLRIIEWHGAPTWSFTTHNEMACEKQPAKRLAQDLAMILLTSGFTGRSKKVPLTHRNVCASAADVSRSLQLSPKDRCLSMWEQYHIGGLVDLLLAPLNSGGCVICAGSFDVQRFHCFLLSHSPTWFQGVPTTLHELIRWRTKSAGIACQHNLRFLRSVAAALPPEWMAELESTYGVPVIQTYGMTEASPLITSNELPPGRRKPGSTGKPCGTEVVIFDDQGCALPIGQIGAIAVRGANVISSYEDNPEANTESFRGGWFFTGDTGYFDEDGFLFLQGRSKELINRGGEKISPFEVEDVLTLHPGIDEACVFAAPHPTLGENVAAAIVPKNGEPISETEIRQHVLAHLSPFKVPDRILFLDHLPRCPIGKVLRRQLVALLPQLAGQPLTCSPNEDLEWLLARLWAQELDIDPPGIDETFTSLGGDSLSSVRLLIAMELLLDIRFPDAPLEHFTTIRHLAEYIVTHRKTRLAHPASPTDEATARKFNPSDSDIRSALATAAIGNYTSQFDSTFVFEQLLRCQAEMDFESLRSSLENELHPAQFLAIANIAERILAGRTHGQGSPPWLGWIEYIVAEIKKSVAHPARWQRRSLAEHAILYSDPIANHADKQLIVVFVGNAQRPMMPIFRFLLQLDSTAYDVLLLRDPDRKHYSHGLRGICRDFRGLCDWLAKTVTTLRSKSVIGLGTSAGGLPALIAGDILQWERAIAICPDEISRHPELLEIMPWTSSGDQPNRSKRLVFYGSENARDCSAADQVAQLMPEVLMFPVSNCGAHNIFHAAFSKGKLGELFEILFHADTGRHVL